MSKVIVYTAIFGSIGDKLQPPVKAADVDFVAFVDDMSKGPVLHGWTLREPVWSRPDKRRQARQHKCLSHELFPAATYTLWVDGCLTPVQNPHTLIDRFLDRADLAMFAHMERSCVYQELEACIRLKKDDPQLMRTQVDEYRREGYPYHNGLAETTAVLRRHTPSICEFNNRWWAEIRQKSVRDQLSVDYLCWKLGLRYSHLDGKRTASPHFKWRPHR